MARAAARSLGGRPEDHRTIGRAAATTLLAGLGWGAVALASTVLGKEGSSPEAGHTEPPTAGEVTGGPGSLVSRTDHTRKSRRWLSMTLTPDHIQSVSGEPATQPIRGYAPLDAASGTQERAELLLAEIDRTGALERPAFALFSPTGNGYVNYVVTETFEYLTRGKCLGSGPVLGPAVGPLPHQGGLCDASDPHGRGRHRLPAQSTTTPSGHAAAEDKVLADVSRWPGYEVDRDAIKQLVVTGSLQA